MNFFNFSIHSDYKKIYAYCSIGTAIVLGALCHKQISHQIEHYAVYVAKQELGAMSLDHKQEAFIKNIADEMHIDEPFIIRKMNHAALASFGYYNAFAYIPTFFDHIPLGTQLYLFVSESFFEDISREEQRFLIGHELVHIKERHMVYLVWIKCIMSIVILAFSYFLDKKLQTTLNRYFNSSDHDFLAIAARVILGIACLITPHLTQKAYQRHIERVADRLSLQTLATYDGCIKLIDRWQKEFKMPLHHPYHELLSDHPSCSERKSYCLELKNASRSSS